MQKIKSAFVLLLLLPHLQLTAQAWMQLGASHIFGGSNYDQASPMSEFFGLALYWDGTTPVRLRVTDNTFINQANTAFQFPIGNVLIQIRDIGGHLPGTSAFEGTAQPLKPLSTTPIDLFLPMGGWFSDRPHGIVNMRLVISNAAIANTTWRQGEYRNYREYTTYTSGLSRYFLPVGDYVYIEAAAILNWQSQPVMTSNNVPSTIFDLFRDPNGLQINMEGTLGTTMPFDLFLRSTANSIMKNGVAANPSIPLSTVTLTGRDVKSNTSFPPVPLASTDVKLNPGTPIPIGSLNRNPLQVTLNIPQAQLVRYYFTPGTYSIPTLNIKGTATATATTYNEVGGVKTLQNTVPSFSFTVPEAQEIRISGSSEIYFDFNSAQSYQAGATHEVIRELTLSSNIGYTVYVKAESAAFQSAGTATIPLDALQIGPLNSESGVNTVNLSNAPQVLVAPSTPILDRAINIKYAIPAAKVRSDIFGKPSGNYKANVIFSFIAN